MPVYRKLNALSQSGFRASYPQGPAAPYALSDLLATPSPAQSKHFSTDGNFFSIRSDDTFDAERLAPPYFGNSPSPSVIDSENDASSQDDNKRASGYTGNDITTFTSTINGDEPKGPPTQSASIFYEPGNPREPPKVAIRAGLRSNLPTLLPHLIAV